MSHDNHFICHQCFEDEQEIKKLRAQVERLRDTVEDAANMLRGGKISPQILLADCDERLAETPAASLAVVREQARREVLEEIAGPAAKAILGFLVDQKYQGEEILHAIIACDFASRSHMEDAVAKVIRELAAQLAKEPHDQV